MKVTKYFVVVAVFISLLAIEGGMLVAPVTATAVPADPPPTFMAGDRIVQGGEFVGCLCPKTSGHCVCQINNTK